MPRHVDHEARKAAIAKAGYGLILKEGIRGLTVRGVARAMGMSTSAVTHYVPTRPELFKLVFELEIQPLMNTVEAALSGIEDDAELVRSFLRWQIEFDETNRSGAIMLEALADPDLAAMQGLFAGYDDWARALVQPRLEKMKLTLTPDTAFDLLMLVANGLTMSTLYSDEPATSGVRWKKAIEALLDRLGIG